MRSKLFVILGLLLILASAASGQTKITGTLSCGKPDTAYSLDVSDRAAIPFQSTNSPAPGPRRWTTAMYKPKMAMT